MAVKMALESNCIFVRKYYQVTIDITLKQNLYFHFILMIYLSLEKKFNKHLYFFESFQVLIHTYYFVLFFINRKKVKKLCFQVAFCSSSLFKDSHGNIRVGIYF